ncbi:hypothetical protein BH11GEM2_BH11GEM2_17120 [soil metagenome]
MNRGVRYSRIVFSALALGACAPQLSTVDHGERAMASMRVSDAERRLLATGNEARSEQSFEDYKDADSRGEMGILNERNSAKFGSITPEADLGQWGDDDFMNGRMVAVVGLEGGDLASLSLYQDDSNHVFLHRNGTVWTARVDDDSKRTLLVTRYTYAGLNAAQFPATARWDWRDNADGTRTLLLGIRCGLGWCLIGTDGKGSGADPADPDIPGTLNPDGTLKTPPYRRVRGWYDRKPIKNSTDFAYIYPGPITATANRDQDFDGGPHHMLSVVVGKNEDTITITHKRKWVFWHRLVAQGGGIVKDRVFDKVDSKNPMPAAARWGSNHIRMAIPPHDDDPIRLAALMHEYEVHPLVRFALNEAWVRCANGCCTTNLDQ